MVRLLLPGVERERPAFCASLGSLRDLSRLWLSFLDITRDGSVIQAAATKSVLLLWCEQVNTDRRPTDAAAPALWRAVRSGELDDGFTTEPEIAVLTD